MEKEKKETLIANSHYVITSNSDRFVVMPALCKLRARLLCSRAFSLFKRYLFAWLSRYITSHVRLPSRDVVRGGRGGDGAGGDRGRRWRTTWKAANASIFDTRSRILSFSVRGKSRTHLTRKSGSCIKNGISKLPRITRARGKLFSNNN